LDSPLVPVFLAIIAVAALLQAAFVAGLAIAMRMADRKLSDVEETLGAQIEAHSATLARLTDAAVRASEQTLAQAERVEGVVTDASEKVDEVMAMVSRRLAAVAGDVEETAEEIEAEPAGSRLAGAAALFRGVQRAVQVWKDTAPAAGPRRR
jgi:hypothetical protein